MFTSSQVMYLAAPTRGFLKQEYEFPNFMEKSNIFASTEFISRLAESEFQAMNAIKEIHRTVSSATNLVTEYVCLTS